MDAFELHRLRTVGALEFTFLLAWPTSLNGISNRRNSFVAPSVGLSVSHLEAYRIHEQSPETPVSAAIPTFARQYRRNGPGAGSWRGIVHRIRKACGHKAIITGADSGIGRAVAIAYAREGADVLVAYIDEHDDAKETERWIKDAGRKAVLVAGDIRSSQHCRSIINKAVEEFGCIDLLVNNAAHQATFKSIDDISDGEWELTFKVNIHAMFYLTKAAVPHMKPGSAIINTASINADKPNPTLLAYATTKGAIQNFTAGLAQLLAEKGIRANAVAPGPIWTPLIPSTMPEDAVANFGKNTAMKRPGQPAELATAYVMLADPMSSYVSGATIAVTGGTPML